MIHRTLFLLSMWLGVALLASCSPAQSSPTSTATSSPVPNMPNPAAVYCEQHGGKSEIVTAADGGQSGLCIFPDGSQCDEWGYFRRECQPGDSLAALAPMVSPTSASTSPTPSTVPANPSPVPTATSLPPLVIDDTWATYTNEKYGFSFRYPSDWKLKEITGSVNTMSGHAIHLLHPTDPTVRLIIAFKRADEDQPITPTGIGGGELVTRGSVSLLGQQVERIVRVELDKDIAVYYGWPRPATTGGDLVFWLALDCACTASDPAVTGLTPEVERMADAIVESIEVTQ
jgi:putative hemolysin